MHMLSIWFFIINCYSMPCPYHQTNLWWHTITLLICYLMSKIECVLVLDSYSLYKLNVCVLCVCVCVSWIEISVKYSTWHTHAYIYMFCDSNFTCTYSDQHFLQSHYCTSSPSCVNSFIKIQTLSSAVGAKCRHGI